MTLYLIRGLPGSGKTTLAKRLNMAYYEADQYFEDEDGKYNFNKAELHAAHDYCQRCVSAHMEQGTHLDVAVSNTFTTLQEMKPYFKIGRHYGVDVQVIECKGRWESIHAVPEHVLDLMEDRWQEYWG